jgi:hypothetical protein
VSEEESDETNNVSLGLGLDVSQSAANLFNIIVTSDTWQLPLLVLMRR